jgi:hypothetical protein
MNLQMLKNKAEEIEKAVHELLKEIRRLDDTDSNPSTEEGASRPVLNAKKLPLGGYKAGWLSPRQLSRETIYEEG